MRVLFSSAPLRGHFFPMVPLALAAVRAGHEVLVAVPECFCPSVRDAGLPVVGWAPALDFPTMVAAETVRDDAARITVHGRVLAQMAAAAGAGADRVLRAWQPDVLISERAELAGPAAAAAHDVPVLQFHWGVGPLIEYEDAAATLFGGRPWTECRSLGAVNPWPPGLRPAFAAGHRSLRPVSYNGSTRSPLPPSPTGRRPRVCVTLGTLVPQLAGLPCDDLIGPLVAALADHADVVVAIDDPDVSASIRRREPRALVGHFALTDLLGECDVIVDHGGQGTVLTALAAGVPQVIVPQFDDQFDNAAAVGRVGVATVLEPPDADPAAVVAAVLELSQPDSTVAAAARALALEAARLPAPDEVLADLVHRLEHPLSTDPVLVTARKTTGEA